jgi:lipopolysaccharide heptosyltransferase II
MIFFRVAGIRCAVGFRVYEGYSLYEKYQQAPIGEVERLLQLIEPLGITASGYALEFPLEPEDIHFASELLQRHGVGKDEVKIVVHPGGKKPTKLWPLSNFISLIDILIKDMGARIILVGSADEVGMANTIEAQVKKEIINITGTHSLSQLAAVIKRADLMVSNDSGPMHIAAAVGTPVVALFSGADIPHLWYPFGNIHRVIRKEVNCSPCFKNQCGEHRCMSEISVEEVFQAVRELLKKGRGKRTEGEVVKGTELKS